MRFDRCRKLFQDDFKKIEDAKILILGVGGVGSFALDCLYRSGVRNITIVDKDIFEITNQNRQIGSESLGEYKVDVLAKKYQGVIGIRENISGENIASFDKEEFDIVLDCIDDMRAKVEVVRYFGSEKLISSLGSAKRIDPSKIRIGKLEEVQNDVFGKKFRKALQKEGLGENLRVVYSDEVQRNKEMGSFCGVTGAFGLFLCGTAIKKIVGEKQTLRTL